jgi:hypothetical protein
MDNLENESYCRHKCEEAQKSSRLRHAKIARHLLIAAVGATLLLPATTAQASSVSFDLDFEFSGAVAPDGAAPWLSATFTDVAPGTVDVTMDATGLNDIQENIKGWYFNLDPVLDLSELTFTNGAHMGSFNNPTFSKGMNSFKADGDGFFDLLFTFAAGGGPNARFNAGEVFSGTFSSTEPISASSFNFGSVGGSKGSLLTAAHVRSTGTGNGDSGWIAPGDPPTPPVSVPEPSIYLSLATILLGGVYGAKRRRAQI